MKQAFSRKNLWLNLSPSARARTGGMIGWIFSRYFLGQRFRRHLAFVNECLPVLYWALERHAWSLARFGADEIQTTSNDARFKGRLDDCCQRTRRKK